MTLHPLDLYILALYLLATLALGFYFSRGQHTTKDYFLAGRAMHWLPVGMSLVATGFSALSFTGVPAAAYESGLLLLPTVLIGWFGVLVACLFIVPLFYNLNLYTAYEYLEKRFNLAVRATSSIAFVLWRILWLGAVIYAPCKVLLFALGIDEYTSPDALYTLMIALGILTTAYTFLGGMKAVIWTDAAQFCAIVGGMCLIVGYCVWGPHGIGIGRVWDINSMAGLTEIFQLKFDWSDRWVLWAMLPHFALGNLSGFAADQITLQRFLTTRDLRSAQQSLIFSGVTGMFFMPLLIALGMSLFAFYTDNPSRYQVLLEKAPGVELRQQLGPGSELDLSGFRPNSRNPHVDTNRVMPHFIVTELPVGLAGLIIAALFAAAMSSMDSGLNSISTAAIIDFHRRLGIGRKWLARRLGKSPEQLDEHDELKLGRLLVIVLGAASTTLAILVSQLKDIFDIMIGVVNTFGGPLLAIFLLGMFVRRVGPRGALTTLILGTLATLWISFAPTLASNHRALAWLWSWELRVASIWNLTFSVAFSLLTGWIVSLLLDRPQRKGQLEGLVVGIGQMGIRDRNPSPEV